MPGERIVAKLFILFHHALFGQGIRSLLRGRRSIQIVGMGKDEAAALREMKSSRPEVILVKECRGKHQPMRLDAFLNDSGGGRVVSAHVHLSGDLTILGIQPVRAMRYGSKFF